MALISPRFKSSNTLNRVAQKEGTLQVWVSRAGDAFDPNGAARSWLCSSDLNGISQL